MLLHSVKNLTHQGFACLFNDCLASRWLFD